MTEDLRADRLQAAAEGDPRQGTKNAGDGESRRRTYCDEHVVGGQEDGLGACAQGERVVSLSRRPQSGPFYSQTRTRGD